MLDRLRKRVPELLHRARWHASDRAWHDGWRAIRAVATPWARTQLDAARAMLAAKPRDVVVERALLDRLLHEAAPPDVPFDVAVLDGDVLRARFGDGPTERRSLHMHGKLRMTHRGIPSRAVVVLALFSDVAADYYVESMAADVAMRLNAAYGEATALADAQANVPILLKEVATAAGLGKIGKNALFYSRRFGFNCKLNVIFVNAPIDRYDPAPTGGAVEAPGLQHVQPVRRGMPGQRLRRLRHHPD